MGFIKIMKSQENPDGMTGHIEREVFDLVRHNGPKKKKFMGNSIKRESNPIFQSQIESTKILEIRAMKKNCSFVTEYCIISRCWNCQRKRELETRQNKFIGYGLNLLEQCAKWRTLEK